MPHMLLCKVGLRSCYLDECIVLYISLYSLSCFVYILFTRLSSNLRA